MAANSKTSNGFKKSDVKVDQYVKAIHAEVEKVSGGTSRAKTTVFTNRDLVKAGKRGIYQYRRSGPQFRQASAKSSGNCVV
ncbi:hypothetical protein ACEQPO_21475 [Bacillus sp. SL00103]